MFKFLILAAQIAVALLVVVLLQLSGTAEARLPVRTSNAVSAAQIEALAKAVMQEHALPGLAIVLVKDGKIAYESGFGVTKIKGGAAVDANTLFRLGSISKPITALALGLLVQQGKVKWDDALSVHIPEFASVNPAVARLTIKQILSHQTGIDLDRLEPLLWPQPNQFKFGNMLAGLKVLAEDARNTGIFRYSNVNYALAGEVVQRASGMSFDAFLQREIFSPLAMNCKVGEPIATYASLRQTVAQPHMIVDGAVQMVRADGEIATLGRAGLDAAAGAVGLDAAAGTVGLDAAAGAVGLDAAAGTVGLDAAAGTVGLDAAAGAVGLDAAAGGVRCDINGLGKWLQFQLNPRASRLRLSDALWRELHAGLAVVRADFDTALRPIGMETYGLGLQIVTDATGIRFDHYGGVAGMYSYFAAYPSQNSGFAVLMNMSAGAARKTLSEQLHRVTRGKPINFKPAPKLKHATAAPVATSAAAAAPEAQALSPSAEAAYFGRYLDAWFGEVHLCKTEGGATFTAHSSPRFKGKLVAAEKNRIAVLWHDPAIQSDAVIGVNARSEPRDAKVQRFRLMPLGESDFDFSAMQFQRIGECQ